MDPMLYKAAMKGDMNYLQTFEERSNLQSKLTQCKETVLHIATEFHRTEFAKAALQFCPALLWLANSSGDTALHIAAREDHADMVEFFISYGRSSGIETGEYETGEYETGEYETGEYETGEYETGEYETGEYETGEYETGEYEIGENETSEYELLTTRMMNLKNDRALHCAARRGSNKCVELLVQADPEICSFLNNDDESPLYLFVISSRFRSKPEIIIKCASSSVSHKGPNGLTALHAAVLKKNYEFENIKLMVEWRKEMIRECDNLGMTPLHYAAFYGGIRAIKLFLEYESLAIYLLNNDGQSALHVAAFNGQVEALKELVNCHPDCYNMVDHKGRTALHAAVLGDQHVVVEFILNTPSLARLINKVDKDGNTPLHLAAYFKFYKTIKSFRKNMKSHFVLNDKFFTPFDVYDKQFYKQDMHQLEEENYTTIVGGRYHLNFAEGVVARHESANEKLKKTKIEPTNVTEETSTNKLKKADRRRGDFAEETALEVNLLVAMLVATVTFAAGFTVPGGLLNNGEDEGLATLTNKPAFKVFIVFNTLAFCCSIFAVLVHFATSLTYREARVYYKGIAASFTAIAILAMVLAFSSGTYVVLTKSTGLSWVPSFIPASFFILYPASRKLNTWMKLRTFGGDLEIPLYLRTRLLMDRRMMQRNKGSFQK